MVTLNTLFHPKHLLKVVAPAALVLLLSLGANAVPMIVTGAAFDGSETQIDFESIALDAEITNDFAGVTFSGGLYGDTVYGPTYIGSGQAAKNFQGGSAPFNDIIEIVFSVSVDRFRFDAITNGADDVELDILSAGGGWTTLSFNTSTTSSSIAVQDLAGIDRFFLRVIGTSNHAFLMDNLEVAVVPEPALLLLLAPAILVIRRRAVV